MAKVHLTKSFVESIACTENRLTFTDNTTRGLTLLVNPTGVKTFYLTRKFRGRVERTLLGRFPELSLGEARKKASYFQVQYDAGINPNEARRQAQAEPTLNAFFEIYYEDHCQQNNKRPEAIRANYARYLAPTLGHLQLSRLQRQDIKAVMKQLGDRGLTRTANVVHGLIRAMLNKALAWEYLQTGKNSAQYIARYREAVRRRVLSPEELPRFHQALALEPSAVNRDAILLLLYTGARSANVFSMHWSEIDFERRLWLIPDTKNGEPHVIALTEEAIAIVERRKQLRASVFVLPGRGSTGHLQNLKKAWERLCDRAGIDDLRIHDLRRTMASWLANLGANQAQIQLQLGHKDPQSVKHYVHPNVDYLRPVVQKVTSALSQH